MQILELVYIFLNLFLLIVLDIVYFKVLLHKGYVILDLLCIISGFDLLGLNIEGI